MLLKLRVKNFGIIDDAEVEFEDGFNVLTGETGAGKSLLVDALLIFFYRGGVDYIKSGAEKAVVEAIFELKEKFPEIEDLIEEDIIIFKKVIHRDGKSKNYINDSLTTHTKITHTLNKILHIYGQSEEKDLYNSAYHLEMFDLYCGVNDIKERLFTFIKKGKELRSKLDEILSKKRERELEIDYLTFQAEEIEKAMLNDDNEEEILRHKKGILQVREKIINNLSKVYQLLYEGDDSVFDKLALSEKMLLDLPLDGTELENIPSELGVRKEDLKNYALEIKNFLEKIREEESPLEEIEDRLNLLFKLKKKYGETIKDIKNHYEEVKKRLEYLKNLEISKEDIERDLEAIREQIRKEVFLLSLKRSEKKEEFEKKILHELKDLGMDKADFEVNIKQVRVDFPENMSEKGGEEIEFYFSAHKSEDKKPLNKIASGGELSRIMLAIKNVIPHEKKKTFIFDEVDSGVGGLTAEMIGKKLKEISKSHQVLCITHLPQVAVFANHHIKVAKKEVNDKVNVTIKAVHGNERIDEITRMLGGDSNSKGRDYALELLKKGDNVD